MRNPASCLLDIVYGIANKVPIQKKYSEIVVPEFMCWLQTCPVQKKSLESSARFKGIFPDEIIAF